MSAGSGERSGIVSRLRLDGKKAVLKENEHDTNTFLWYRVWRYDQQ